MTEMAILPSFTAEGNLLMKKALYYDFMLFRRNQKPFNAFLLKKGLRNTMYSPPKNVNGSVDPYSSMRGIIRYDDGLHTDLSPPNRFNPTDNVNLVSILERFLAVTRELFKYTTQSPDNNIKYFNGIN